MKSFSVDQIGLSLLQNQHYCTGVSFNSRVWFRNWMCVAIIMCLKRAKNARWIINLESKLWKVNKKHWRATSIFFCSKVVSRPFASVDMSGIAAISVWSGTICQSNFYFACMTYPNITGYAPESLCTAEVFCSHKELASETRCEDVKIRADRFIFCLSCF